MAGTKLMGCRLGDECGECEEVGIVTCEDFLPYDGLAGTVDFDMNVTRPGGADECCDDMFVGVSGGVTDWFAGGGVAGGEYLAESGNGTQFCDNADWTWERAATFVCLGDEEFGLTITASIFSATFGPICTFEWNGGFPFPFIFGATYTVPFLVNTCVDFNPCDYVTGGWTVGNATISFTEPS